MDKYGDALARAIPADVLARVIPADVLRSDGRTEVQKRFAALAEEFETDDKEKGAPIPTE